MEFRNKTIPIIVNVQKLAFLIATSNMLSFHWVPGHDGIVGNEITDHEARAAAENPRTGMKNAKVA